MAKRPIKVEVGDTIVVQGAATFVCTGLTLQYNEPAMVIFETPEELITIQED